MSAISEWLERLWWSAEPPPLALQLCTRLYDPVNRRNLQRRMARQEDCGLPLISIGNITVGGSGKTPFTIWLAKSLQQRGIRPAILCRGDGGAAHAPLWLSAETPCEQAGDEAVLLHRSSGCPVMAARDRVAASREIAASGCADVIILDDGFQYRQLHRCCDVVMIPAQGIGNGCLLPAGPLRESVGALQRASLIVRSDHQQPRTRPRPLGERREWQWQAMAGKLCDWAHSSSALPADSPLNAISGIARPQRFLDNLEELGYALASRHIHRDHYRYSAQDAAALAQLPYPVTTAKDAVKLLPLWPAGKSLWVLEQRIDCEQGLLDAIIEQTLRCDHGNRIALT